MRSDPLYLSITVIDRELTRRVSSRCPAVPAQWRLYTSVPGSRIARWPNSPRRPDTFRRRRNTIRSAPGSTQPSKCSPDNR